MLSGPGPALYGGRGGCRRSLLCSSPGRPRAAREGERARGATEAQRTLPAPRRFFQTPGPTAGKAGRGARRGGTLLGTIDALGPFSRPGAPGKTSARGPLRFPGGRSALHPRATERGGCGLWGRRGAQPEPSPSRGGLLLLREGELASSLVTSAAVVTSTRVLAQRVPTGDERRRSAPSLLFLSLRFAPFLVQPDSAVKLGCTAGCVVRRFS